MDAIKFVQEQMLKKPEFPKFKAGDNITVNYQIKEGDKTVGNNEFNFASIIDADTIAQLGRCAIGSIITGFG